MLHIVHFPQSYHPFLQELIIIKVNLESPNWIFWFIIAQILLHWSQRFQFTGVLRREQRVPQVEERRMLLVVTHEMTPLLMTAWFKKTLTLPQAWASRLTFIHLPISAIMTHTPYGHQFTRWSLEHSGTHPSSRQVKLKVRNKTGNQEQTVLRSKMRESITREDIHCTG